MRAPAVTVMTLLLATGAALAASTADAHCGEPEPCHNPLPNIAGLGQLLAADGVLGYVVSDGRAAEALDYFTVTVRDSDGVVVDGTIELRADYSAILWRPTAPWIPGARYSVTTRYEKARWAEVAYGAPPESCPTHDGEAELTIDGRPLPGPEMPPTIITTRYETRRDDSLAAIVCCDGAMPFLRTGPGSCPMQEVAAGLGACRAHRELGVLRVHHALDLDALPHAAANFAVRIVDAGELRRYEPEVVLSAPECLRFEILDLARGQTYVDERCHGDGIADRLGSIAVDPAPDLAAACDGQAYVCEELPGGGAWDETRCKTWPGGADHDPGASGCGCSSGRNAPFLWLGVWLLLRRARPNRPPADTGPRAERGARP